MKSNLKDKCIGVLLGGLSKEREISLKSGKAVAKALSESGFKKVVEVDADYSLDEKLRKEKVEVAFIALHGKYGEDGTVQGLLEFMKIPYTGSGVLGSAISLSKTITKRIFEIENISTPKYRVYKNDVPVNKISSAVKNSFGYPLVIKPSNEGSTIGLSIVKNEKNLEEAVQTAFEHDSEIVVEEYIAGSEITVAILDGKALPVVEIVPKEGFFDYKAKYTKGMTEYFVPARISDKVTKKAQEYGVKAFSSLSCSGFGRVDMLVDAKDDIYVLEVNSIPGMTDTSLVPMAAKEIGMKFNKLIETIIMGASLKNN